MTEVTVPVTTSWEPVLTGRTSAWFRRYIWATVVVLAACAGALGYLVMQVNAEVQRWDGRFLPGTAIADVDISGMTVTAARAAVAADIEPQLDRVITLRWDEQSWDTSPRNLGATHDADAAVDDAMAHRRRLAWGDFARLRFQQADLGFSRGVTIDTPQAGARAWVEEIAATIERPAVDAAVDYTGGMPLFTAAQTGYGVMEDASTTSLMGAVERGDAQAPFHVLTFQPAVTAESFGRVLFLRQDQHKLYLYEHGQLRRQWTVATGTAGYPTPTGEYTVEEKRHMPVWINPDPNGWGRDLPASIAPGLGNPLGLRAINWSGGDAIRFHGTQAIHSLGTDASHGCVRMANADVVELFDLVEVGDRIISVDL